MPKDLKSYVGECFRLSYKAVLQGAESLLGAVATALISLALANYLTPWIESMLQREDSQEVGIWVAAVIIFILFYLPFRMVFVAPFILYWRQREESRSLRSRLECSDDAFDMGAEEAADYIIEHLSEDSKRANMFVEHMASEKRVQIRAIDLMTGLLVPFDPQRFHRREDDYNRLTIHLIGTENDRTLNEQFRFAFHEEGWISWEHSTDVVGEMPYFSPRFISGQVKSVVEWYSKCNPPGAARDDSTHE